MDTAQECAAKYGCYMTDKQPESLRLADELNALLESDSLIGASTIDKAAAELRRLHEENKQLQEKCRKYIEIHDAVVADSDKLRAALAQPEHGCAECDKKQSEGWALYCVDCLREFYKLDPTNQRREWVGLTDEDKKEIYEQADAESWHDQPLLEAVEAKLKEKNT